MRSYGPRRARGSIVFAGLACGAAFFLMGVSEPVSLSTSTVHPLKSPTHKRRRATLAAPLERMGSKLHKETQELRQTIETHGRPNPAVEAPEPGFRPPAELPLASPIAPVSPGERFVKGLAKVLTKEWHQNVFIWLPVIATDPNAGLTLGFMPILLVPAAHTHKILHLIAPSYTYSSLFGHTLSSNYFLYPTTVSQFDTEASISQRTNRDLEAHYHNNAAWGLVGTVSADAGYTVDGAHRFYGIGPQTRSADKSGYTSKLGFARLAPGINFLRAWRLTAGVAYRQFGVDTNHAPRIADLQARYPDVPGVGGTDSVTNELRLLWDTRDSAETPSRGSAGELSLEHTNRALGSDTVFQRYRLEGKRFFPWRGDQQVTVIRGRVEKVNGSFIPFQELSMLGGRTTLRGYGDGRFADHGSIVVNLEQRIQLASIQLMDMETHVELTPFLDLGTVFPNLAGIERRNVRSVEGVAFRTAFKPNVVGDFEVGVGNEGPAFFVDINYPF